MSRFRSAADRLLPLIAGGAAFLLYRSTAFPGVGGRFHPIDPQLHQHYGLVVGPFNSPWHPLYYSLTWLLQWLPSHLSFPERVTFFSSVFGAASVALAYLVAYHVTDRQLPSLAAALAYAASYSPWIQSTEAEVYTLQMTLSFLVILLLLAWARDQKPYLLWAAIFVYFQCYGVTLSMVLLLPALLYFVAATNFRQILKPGTLLVTFVSGVVAALQYAPCYFRAFQAEPLAWGRNRPADLASYLSAVTGDIFHGAFFAYSLSELLLDRVPLLWWYWHREFFLAGAVALVVGLVALHRRQPKVFVFLVVGFASVFAFCANYGVDDIEVFFLLSAVFSVPIMAEGVAAIGRRFPGRIGTTVVLLICLVWVGGSIALTLPSFKLQVQPDQSLRRFISGLEPDAVLVNTNYSWGLTMKLRALLFTEPGLAGRKAKYLEAGPDLGDRRRFLADPDVVVPAALLRKAPVYVLADYENNVVTGEVHPVGITLNELVGEMREGDRLVVAWSGNLSEQLESPPFRTIDDQTRTVLRQIGLSGGSGEDRFYLGIGCKDSSCRSQETGIVYTPFSLRLNHVLSIPGRREIPLVVDFSGQERDFSSDADFTVHKRGNATAIALNINGEDALAFARRPISVGFPKSRPGPEYARTIVSDTALPQGSVAALIDGRTGRVRSLVRALSASHDPPVFEKTAEYCRVVPKSFDAGGTIVFGVAEARPYLGSGFDLDTVYHGTPVVHSTGPRSHIYIPMTNPGSRYRLQLEARLAAGDERMIMDMAVNDREVYRSSLKQNTLHTIVVDLPAGLMKSGINHIAIHYSRTVSYFDLNKGLVKDTAQRAVRLHSLSIAPIAER